MKNILKSTINEIILWEHFTYTNIILTDYITR